MMLVDSEHYQNKNLDLLLGSEPTSNARITHDSINNQNEEKKQRAKVKKPVNRENKRGSQQIKQLKKLTVKHDTVVNQNVGNQAKTKQGRNQQKFACAIDMEKVNKSVRKENLATTDPFVGPFPESASRDTGSNKGNEIFHSDIVNKLTLDNNKNEETESKILQDNDLINYENGIHKLAIDDLVSPKNNSATQSLLQHKAVVKGKKTTKLVNQRRP